MAGAGPAAPPKQPASNGIDNVWRAGPFTNTPGTTHDVVVFNANRLNTGSAIASIAVLSNGIDSAGAPANTAFTAIFSTVQRPLRGGSSARHSSGNRPDATRYSRTRSSVGGTSGRPSPQPASVASFWKATGSSSTSRRPLVSQSSSHPSGPQSTRPAISLCSWLIALLPHSEGLEQTFDDVAAFASTCRFGDCSHESEPGCAVREALRSGALPRDRFDSWRKLQRELGRLERRLDARARSEHAQQIRKEARQRRRTQRPPRGRAR